MGNRLPARRTLAFVAAAVFAAGAYGETAGAPAWAAGNTTYAIVLDASGSMNMAGTDSVSRIESAKASLLKMLPDLLSQSKEMGLTVFGHRLGDCVDIETTVPISADGGTAIRNVLPSIPARGTTPLASAIESAGRDLIQAKKGGEQQSFELIILTDGEETCGGDPVGVVKSLRKALPNLKVHLIGYGPDDLLDYYLSKISETGGGTFHGVNSKDELETAIQDALKGIQGTRRSPAPATLPRILPPAPRALRAPFIPNFSPAQEGIYQSRPKAPPATATQSNTPAPAKDGDDEEQPIIDPASVPKSITFDVVPALQAPPPLPLPPRTPPPRTPPPPLAAPEPAFKSPPAIHFLP